MSLRLGGHVKLIDVALGIIVLLILHWMDRRGRRKLREIYR
jgi:hypothetical protein